MDKKTHKVLIVDDDKFLLDMYCMKFKKNGYEVAGMPGGTEALVSLRGGFAPDIIMTDLVMPGVSGFEFLETVQKEALAAKAALIILTNQGQSADIEKAKKLGVDGYIVKASTIPSEVVEQVKKIFTDHSKKK